MQQLLAFVSGGSPDAGAAYRRMHAKLEAYFRWQAIEGGRELADKTMDRIARRLAAGASIAPEPADYILEVARAIAREESGAEKEPARDVSQAEEQARVEALEACLLVLGDQDRAVFEPYQARAEARAKIAQELGVSLPMLRLKASRIRARVERSMNARLSRGDEEEA